jgi:hypothetical protein
MRARSAGWAGLWSDVTSTAVMGAPSCAPAARPITQRESPTHATVRRAMVLGGPAVGVGTAVVAPLVLLVVQP